MKARKGP